MEDYIIALNDDKGNLLTLICKMVCGEMQVNMQVNCVLQVYCVKGHVVRRSCRASQSRVQPRQTAGDALNTLL